MDQQTGLKISPLFFGHCLPNFKGRLFASYMRSIIKEGGSVKACGTEIGRLRDVAKPLAVPKAGRVFKEVDTLFTDKTGPGLDRFDKGPWAFLQTQGQGSVREVERVQALVS